MERVIENWPQKRLIYAIDKNILSNTIYDNSKKDTSEILSSNFLVIPKHRGSQKN